MTPWYFNPVMFQIGPIQAHWYGFMYALAFLLGYLYLKKRKIAQKLTDPQKDNLLFIAILGVILGGRFGYVLFYNLSYYFQNPLKIFSVWEGGMSFHGGLIGVTLGIFWFSRKYKHDLFYLGDIVTSYAPAALFLGRIGNFINGELYGRIAKNFCLYFPTDPQNCRYPSQLLEAFLEGIILFIIMQLVLRKKPAAGVISSLFLIFYGIFRIIAEFFREPDVQIGYLFGWLTEGQLLSLLMIAIGAVIYFSNRKKHGYN